MLSGNTQAVQPADAAAGYIGRGRRASIPRFKFRLLGSKDEDSLDEIGVIVAMGRHLQGHLRYHEPVRPAGEARVVDPECDGAELIPTTPNGWKNCFVTIDALNVSVFSDDQCKNLLYRFDVYSVGKHVQNLTGGVFAFPVPYSFPSKWIFFETGSVSLCSLWVEAIYQTRSLRVSSSFTRCTTLERFICGCVCGADLFELMFQFVLFNLFTMVFGFVSDILDAKEVLSAKTSLSIANDVLCTVALLSLQFIHSRKQRMEEVLYKAKYLCAILSLLYCAEVGISFWAMEDNDEVGNAFRHRLMDFADILNLVMWLNGLYLCYWAELILAYDVSNILEIGPNQTDD